MFLKRKKVNTNINQTDYIQRTYESLEEYSAGSNFRDFCFWSVSNLNSKGYDGKNIVSLALERYAKRTEELLQHVNGSPDISFVAKTRMRCHDILRAIDDNLFDDEREKWENLFDYCSKFLPNKKANNEKKDADEFVRKIISDIDKDISRLEKEHIRLEREAEAHEKETIRLRQISNDLEDSQEIVQKAIGNAMAKYGFDKPAIIDEVKKVIKNYGRDSQESILDAVQDALSKVHLNKG